MSFRDPGHSDFAGVSFLWGDQLFLGGGDHHPGDLHHTSIGVQLGVPEVKCPNSLPCPSALVSLRTMYYMHSYASVRCSVLMYGGVLHSTVQSSTSQHNTATVVMHASPEHETLFHCLASASSPLREGLIMSHQACIAEQSSA